MGCEIRLSTMSVPVTALKNENPLPIFRSPADRYFREEGLPLEESAELGKNTGFRVLPYRMQDRYEPKANLETVQTVVMENDRLRAVFLPQYGGRLYSLWDKEKQRECVYGNGGIQLRNLALRNAWFSGGVEWNFGHFGHSWLTCDKVFFAVCKDGQGEAFLRMYEYERCKQVVFQVDFHLPQGASALTAHLCILNGNAEDVPVFLWTNTAVPEERGMHVYSGTHEVIAQRVSNEAAKSYFFHGTLPELYQEAQDASDPTEICSAAEYFFQNSFQTEAAFEAVHYPDGRLFAERSTENMPYRKMFCWGNHRGGQNWQRFLDCGEKGNYVEVQAGQTRTQVHPFDLPAHAEIHITQQFTMTDLERREGEYEQERLRIQAAVEHILPKEALQEEHLRCTRLSMQAAQRILLDGSGWGALECKRDHGIVPAHLAFPERTMGDEQRPWLALLEGKCPDTCASFMVSEPWTQLMEQAEPKTAELWNLLGIAYEEQGRHQLAKQAWDTSLTMKPTALALRNLGQLAWREKQWGEAQTRMEQALRMITDDEERRPYAEEYLQLLTEMSHDGEAFAFYRSLSAVLQTEERLRLIAMRSAAHLGEDEFLREQFAAEFTIIREGEISLQEPWMQYIARQYAKENGVPVTEELLMHIKRTHPIAEHLDFRMAPEA